MKYLYETHLHTKETSRCGQNTAADMVKHHARLGFTGVFITDHFVTGHSHGNIDAPWDERIKWLLKGYNAAKEVGDQVGLDVFFAWEYPSNGADLLTYGLDAQFLLDHPELAQMDVNDYAALVRKSGGFIVQAHPFRAAEYIPNGVAGLVEGCYDAIEVYNGSHQVEAYNIKALKAATDLNCPMTAGSDTHGITMSGTGYMAFDHRLKDAQDFIAQIKSGTGEIIKKARL